MRESGRRAALGQLLRAFRPMPIQVDGRERWRALLGGGLGLLCTALLSRLAAGPDLAHSPWLIAPIGASAVLVFAVPASPLAQPWSVVGGNTLSALVGALSAMLIPDPAFAGALAVALAIGAMFTARCLHPPGGAAALLCALGGVGLHFVLFPVLVNCVLLVAAGMAYNHFTGRSYPHRSLPPPAAARFSAADLDAALVHYNQVLDVSRDDLQELLHHAESAAYQRRFGDLTCGDVMSPDPVAAQFGTSLQEAWSLMRERRVKALPVTDKARHLVGIVTQADFMRHAGIDRHGGMAERLRHFMRPSGTSHSDRPEVVGQIMTREVRVVSATRRVAELIPLFSEAGHHHVPVIDGQRRLVGIITQTDLMHALHFATQAA